MSAWLAYALLAPFLFSISNIFDKFLRDKHLGTFTLSVLVGLSSLWVLVLLAFVKFPASPTVVIASLIAGALSFSTSFPFFQALSIEEASRVVPLWALQAPMVLVLAFVFLKERLVVNDYIGFFLVVTGAFLVLTKKLTEVLTPSKAFFLMLLASSLASISIVVSKWLYSEASFWSVQVLMGLGAGSAALLTLLIFSSKRKGLFKEISTLHKTAALLGLRVLIFIPAGLLFSLAIMTGSSSLSTALVQLSSLCVFIIATVLSRFLPHILEEKIDRKTLLTKAIAILMIIAGIFAINM